MIITDCLYFLKIFTLELVLFLFCSIRETYDVFCEAKKDFKNKPNKSQQISEKDKHRTGEKEKAREDLKSTLKHKCKASTDHHEAKYSQLNNHNLAPLIAVMKNFFEKWQHEVSRCVESKGRPSKNNEKDHNAEGVSSKELVKKPSTSVSHSNSSSKPSNRLPISLSSKSIVPVKRKMPAECSSSVPTKMVKKELSVVPSKAILHSQQANRSDEGSHIILSKFQLSLHSQQSSRTSKENATKLSNEQKSAKDNQNGW